MLRSSVFYFTPGIPIRIRWYFVHNTNICRRRASAKLKNDLAFKKVKDGLWEVKPKFRDSYTVTVILSCTPCTLISCILPEDSSDESTQCEESQTSQYNLQSTHSLYY